MTSNIPETISNFAIEGTLVDFRAITQGHIHDTYLGSWMHAGTLKRYIHQRINSHVFCDVDALMQNVSQVIACLKAKLAAENSEETLFGIIPTKDGALYLKDGPKFWRTYEFIEDSETFDLPQDTPQAFAGAKTFGKFLKRLSDLDVNLFHETIKGFQDTPGRFERLKRSVATDALKRVASVKKELDFVSAREKFGALLSTALSEKRIPLRITHGDPKFNNILFSKITGKPLCVVDLDTCMPGSILYDFGDLIRASGTTMPEDETDIDKVKLDMPLYEALSLGFLEGVGDVMQADEIALLPVTPRLIALTLGIRFLTDYLEGDHYFKIAHTSHNLQRCRMQFKLVEDMEAREADMQRVIKSSTSYHPLKN